MRIVNQSYLIMTTESEMIDITKRIERIARTCYQSEGKINEGSDIELCRKLVERGHFPMLDHVSITVKFITNRGVTHELVRHRHAAFAQESTRYVKYGEGMEFIRPVFEWAINKEYKGYVPAQYVENFDKQLEKWRIWLKGVETSSEYYSMLIRQGCPPQEAREVLPNALKAEIIVTADITEWRHILKLRTSKAAHPQIRALMVPLLEDFKFKLPVLFADIPYSG